MKLKYGKNRSIKNALAFSMIFSLVAKIFSFGQSIVISYAFGVQRSTDVLFFSISFIVLLTSFVSCVNQQAVVPTAIKIRQQRSDEDSKKFLSYVYLIYLIIGILGSSVLLIGPFKTIAFFSKFSVRDITDNMVLIYSITPMFFLTLLNTLMLDIITSYKHFSTPMILDIAKNSCIIAFVLIFKDVFSVQSLAIGIIIGNTFQFIILNTVVFKLLNFKLSFKRYWVDLLVKKNIMYVVMGQFATFLNGITVNYLMSGFTAGLYSAMDYSQKLYTIFVTVVIGQISTVIGIEFIEMFAEKKFEKLKMMFEKYLVMALFLIIPVCCILSINSESIIYILFKRGKFSYDAVLLTSEFFRIFILIIPLRLVDSLVSRLMIAKQIQKNNFIWQLISNILQISGIWITVKVAGYVGYPLGTLLFYSLYVVLYAYINLKYQFKFIGTGVLKHVLYNVILNIVIMGAAYWGLSAVHTPDNVFGHILRVILTSAIYLMVYIGISRFLPFNRDMLKEVSEFVNGMTRKFKVRLNPR